jgi:hypothetical protein
VVEASLSSDATEGGVGPLVRVLVAVPPVVSAEGVMSVSGTDPMFITVITTVTVPPLTTLEPTAIEVTWSLGTFTVTSAFTVVVPPPRRRTSTGKVYVVSLPGFPIRANVTVNVFEPPAAGISSEMAGSSLKRYRGPSVPSGAEGIHPEVSLSSQVAVVSQTVVLGLLIVTRSTVPDVRPFVTVKLNWTAALPATTESGLTVTL